MLYHHDDDKVFLWNEDGVPVWGHRPHRSVNRSWSRPCPTSSLVLPLTRIVWSKEKKTIPMVPLVVPRTTWPLAAFLPPVTHSSSHTILVLQLLRNIHRKEHCDGKTLGNRTRTINFLCSMSFPALPSSPSSDPQNKHHILRLFHLDSSAKPIEKMNYKIPKVFLLLVSTCH